MSLLFDNAASEYLERTASIPTLVFPFAIAAWVYIDDLTGDQTVVSFADSATDNENHSLMLASGIPRARSRSGGVNGDADATEAVTLNTWHHLTAIFISATEREIYLDGRPTTLGTDVTNLTPSGLDAYSVARLGQSTPGNYVSGRVAEVSVWNLSTTLTQLEIESIGQHRISGLQLRTVELTLHDKLLGQMPTIDMLGAYSLTAFNTPTVADHPPVGQQSSLPMPIDFSVTSEVSQAWGLGQTVVAQVDHYVNVSQLWGLVQEGRPGIFELTVSNAITFDQALVIGKEIVLALSNHVNFSVSGKRTYEQTVANAIVFAATVDKAVGPTNVLVFGQTLVINVSKGQSNGLAFGQSVVIGKEITRPLTNDITFGQSVVLSVERSCDLHTYSPFGGVLPVLTLGTRSTILLQCTGASIELRNPILGNTSDPSVQRAFNKSRGGTVNVYRDDDRPKSTRITLGFTNLTRAEAQALQTFMQDCLGQSVTMTDQDDSVWVGIIVEPQTPIAQQRQGTCDYSAEFEFIGNRL